MKQTIILTIAGTDFTFNYTAQDHSNFVDATARRESITAAAHNLVMRTISPDQKDAMKALLEKSPGATVHIASELGGEFSPVLEITVKK
jgi:hypothetical protein